jgi:PleD family two-component response regulator
MLAFQRPSDLALLDVGLPDMDGLQVLAALRAHARTLFMPVVMRSSCDDPKVMRRRFELGAIEYLVKTEAPTRVSDRVARWTTAQGTRQRGASAGASELSGMQLRPSLRRWFNGKHRFPGGSR